MSKVFSAWLRDVTAKDDYSPPLLVQLPNELGRVNAPHHYPVINARPPRHLSKWRIQVASAGFQPKSQAWVMSHVN